MFRYAFVSAAIALHLGNIASASTFYTGADVSLLPFIESAGGTFKNSSGVAAPFEQIVSAAGANMFRLRLFVNPDTNYSDTSGAIQTLDYDIALAQRLQRTGAKILLDLHYSDTWADPSHQAKPAAWSSQTLASTPSLQSTLRNYTLNTLNAFQSAGIKPAMVQVGNEITNGMLFDDGKVVYTGTTAAQTASWQNFGTLLNSAISGVRDFDAQTAGQHTNVALHIDGGDVSGRASYFYNQITNVAGVSDYDTFGMSFYPTTSNGFSNLQGNFTSLVNNSDKQIMVLETNYPYQGNKPGSGSNRPSWAATPAGQAQFFGDVQSAVASLPNNRGEGALWWYPESVQVPGYNIYKGGNVAWFDGNGNPLPILSTLPEPSALIAAFLSGGVLLSRRRQRRRVSLAISKAGT